MNVRMKSSTRGVNSPIRGLPKEIPASTSEIRTGFSSETTNARPLRKNSMPSVAMKELIPTIITKNALTAPIASPTARAAATPKARSSKLAITTPHTAKVLATLRSSSPMRITAVSPKATSPIKAMRPRVTS